MSGLFDSDVQVKRLRQVSVQCYLFVAVFFITTGPFFAMQVLESLGIVYRGVEADFYPLWALQSFLTPLNGFLNAVIFFRPRYLAARSGEMDGEPKGRLVAMKSALREPYYGTENKSWGARRRSSLNRRRRGMSADGSGLFQPSTNTAQQAQPMQMSLSSSSPLPSSASPEEVTSPETLGIAHDVKL